MTTLREAAQQALEAWDGGDTEWFKRAYTVMENLRAALAEPTVKESLQVESAFAENATTQQQLEEAPPSDYRRGYWDGFEIGKREGRIEAENALAEPVQEPAAIVGTQEDTWKGYGGQWAPPGPPIKTVHMLRELPEGALLYAAPPQRKPLSDADLAKIWDDALDQLDPRDQLRFIARAIERAHGIGGEG